MILKKLAVRWLSSFL